MSNVTELGKVLRKIRIDHGIVLKDMADVLGITSSYLSAVENGKRKAKLEWVDLLESCYNLTKLEVETLIKLINISIGEIKISIENLSETQQDIAMLFAREFKNMSVEDKNKMMRILKK